MEGLGLEEGGGGGEGSLWPLMQSIMQNLLSKDVLYPSLKEITEKVRHGCTECRRLQVLPQKRLVGCDLPAGQKPAVIFPYHPGPAPAEPETQGKGLPRGGRVVWSAGHLDLPVLLGRDPVGGPFPLPAVP